MDSIQQERTTDPYPTTGMPRAIQPEPHSMTTRTSFAHEIPLPPSEDSIYECCLSSFGLCFGILGALPCFVCLPSMYKTVPQGFVGMVTKFGKYYKTLDPGLYKINVFTEGIKLINIKLRLEDIPAQVITTKDNVTVIIDSVLYWHIIDPFMATYLVEEVGRALIERAQTTLRQIMGKRTLQEAIEHRETIAEEIEGIIGKSAKAWGVIVESILIKDLKFSLDLQENLSAAAKQKRIGESKIIAAQAEVDSAKLFREAADILSSDAAMQIRYLDTMLSMAKTAGTKVIFMPANDIPGPAAASASKGIDFRTVLAKEME